MSPTTAAILGDAVMVIHFIYIAIVVVGLAIIWVGAACGWRWVRNPWFRVIHSLMIGIVVAESIVGFECPLTTWENDLKQAAGMESNEGGFIATWMHKVIFYEGCTEEDNWKFTVAYIAFGSLVLLSFWLVPLRWRGRASS